MLLLRGPVTGSEQGCAKQMRPRNKNKSGEGALNIHSTDIPLCHILFNNNEDGQARRRVLKLALARRVMQHQVTTTCLTWGKEDLQLSCAICFNLSTEADGWGPPAWEEKTVRGCRFSPQLNMTAADATD